MSVYNTLLLGFACEHANALIPDPIIAEFINFIYYYYNKVTKNKILIIGSGKDIQHTFKFIFHNHKIKTIGFRYAWKNHKKINKTNKILLSGFDHNMCSMKYLDFLTYIKNYYKFILNIKKKCDVLYVVSTDLNIKLSISRVVYFYLKIVNLIKQNYKNNNIKIIMFDTIVGTRNNLPNKIKISLFNILKIKKIYYKQIKLLINNNFLSKRFKIKFYLIEFPRKRITDRFLRLIFDLIILKNFVNDKK